ncbi:hypothetical protein V6N12_003679 [Hibiscus sabdariffa]|uniref:Uncharacterized protein n=1 Tax=Hibiscus sabdariffa TaxID=183260 RepID=A0ABR2AMQ5_9ROSI
MQIYNLDQHKERYLLASVVQAESTRESTVTAIETTGEGEHWKHSVQLQTHLFSTVVPPVSGTVRHPQLSPPSQAEQGAPSLLWIGLASSRQAFLQSHSPPSARVVPIPTSSIASMPRSHALVHY